MDLMALVVARAKPRVSRSLAAGWWFAGLVAVAFGALAARAADTSPVSASLRVDLTQPGPVIPEYLYGQFIEHLGRCIHDGIWAEKLRDRKFLLEPGKVWQPVRPEGAVAEVLHDSAGAYAGDRCMALWVREAKGGMCPWNVTRSGTTPSSPP
jgi:hypothetical protein